MYFSHKFKIWIYGNFQFLKPNLQVYSATSSVIGFINLSENSLPNTKVGDPKIQK